MSFEINLMNLVIKEKRLKKVLKKNVDSYSLTGVLVGVAADFYIARSKKICMLFGFFQRVSSPDPLQPCRRFKKPLGHAGGPSGSPAQW